MTKIICPHCDKGLEVEISTVTQIADVKPDTPTPKPDGIPFVNTEQAKQMRNKINIEGVIERKGGIRTINLKSGGTLDTVDAFLVDDVGEIKIQFWGEDTTKINDGIKIRITNGYTNSFKGETSLTKGKYGQMEILS